MMSPGYIAALAMFCTFIGGLVSEKKQPALRATDLTNGTFRAKLYIGKRENCLAENVTYARLLGTGPQWGIPHSLISMDGNRCGPFPENSTDEELDGDAWMDVFPFKLVATQAAAHQANLIRPYAQLSASGLLRDYVIHLALQMGEERAHSEIFLGYEGNRIRRCGNIAVPLESFVVFARITNHSINYGSLLRNGRNARLFFQKDAPYHVIIAPASTGTPRFCPYLLPADFYRKYPVRTCFPADARVRLRSGREIPMTELRIGDEVEFVDEGGRQRHSPVILFTHRDNRTMLHEFIRISLHTGESITLSPGHFIDNERVASEITVGDRLVVANGSYSRVLRMQSVRAHGLFNPQTASGHLIVNGVSVSAYTHAVPPVAAHSALLPFRLWAQWLMLKNNQLAL